MRTWLFRILGSAVALLLVALLVYAFIPKPVVVEAGTVSKGTLIVSVDSEGKTRLRERYTLEAPVPGTLARVEVQPGDPVKAGTALARLAPLPSALLDPQSRLAAEARLRSAQDARRQARTLVERATAALRYAQLDLDRMRKLAEAGAATRQSLDVAELHAETQQAELRAARFSEQVAAHEVEVAEAALRERAQGASATLALSAPVDGRVLRVPREHEGPVAAGTPVVEVGDPTDLEVVAQVLTRDALGLRPGLKALVTGWGGELTGRVRVVEPAAFTKVSPLGVEEQRVNVVVAFDGPGAGAQGLGEAWAVDVRFVRAELAQVLRIPASAVFRHGAGWAAFTVRDGRAVLQAVDVGATDATRFELRSGLAEGDTVVVHPGELVRDGVRVLVARTLPP